MPYISRIAYGNFYHEVVVALDDERFAALEKRLKKSTALPFDMFIDTFSGEPIAADGELKIVQSLEVSEELFDELKEILNGSFYASRVAELAKLLLSGKEKLSKVNHALQLKKVGLKAKESADSEVESVKTSSTVRKPVKAPITKAPTPAKKTIGAIRPAGRPISKAAKVEESESEAEVEIQPAKSTGIRRPGTVTGLRAKVVAKVEESESESEEEKPKKAAGRPVVRPATVSKAAKKVEESEPESEEEKPKKAAARPAVRQIIRPGAKTVKKEESEPESEEEKPKAVRSPIKAPVRPGAKTVKKEESEAESEEELKPKAQVSKLAARSPIKAPVRPGAKPTPKTPAKEESESEEEKPNTKTTKSPLRKSGTLSGVKGVIRPMKPTPAKVESEAEEEKPKEEVAAEVAAEEEKPKEETPEAAEAVVEPEVEEEKPKEEVAAEVAAEEEKPKEEAAEAVVEPEAEEEKPKEEAAEEVEKPKSPLANKKSPFRSPIRPNSGVRGARTLRTPATPAKDE